MGERLLLFQWVWLQKHDGLVWVLKTTSTGMHCKHFSDAQSVQLRIYLHNSAVITHLTDFNPFPPYLLQCPCFLQPEAAGTRAFLPPT